MHQQGDAATASLPKLRKREAFYQNPGCAQGWLPKPSSQLETKDGQMGKDLAWLRSGTEMRKKPYKCVGKEQGEAGSVPGLCTEVQSVGGG